MLNGHSDRVTRAAISSDDSFAVSGSDDCTVRIWDLKTSKAVRVLKGHSDAVDFVAISSNCSFVVSSSKDCTIRVWNLGTGEAVRVLRGYDATWTRSIAISRDDKFVTSTSDWKDSCFTWNLETGTRLADEHSIPADTGRSHSSKPNSRFYALSDKWVLDMPASQRVCRFPSAYPDIKWSTFSSSCGIFATSDDRVIILRLPPLS